MCRQVLINVWLLFGSIALLSCSPTDGLYTGEDNSTTQTTGGNNKIEQSPETCTAPVEMTEGEKALSDMSVSELSFLKTTTFRPQIAVRIPQTLQKSFDYLNTYVKSPLAWLPRELKRDMDNRLSNYGKGGKYDGLPKAYADGAGNNNHLAVTPPIQMPWIEGRTALFFPAVLIAEGFKIGVFANARLTYDAIDYFANAKCPATITGKDGYTRDDGHFKATFPNGNEIKLSPYGRETIAMRNLNFWVGRDKNLKMVYKDGSNSTNSTYKLKFATFAECGERLPDLDYECRVDFSNADFEGSTCP